MRRAKSYSIVDHELLHGGFLARLTHQALALYLFLCVVGDRDGRSFYRDGSICKVLRLSFDGIALARSELIAAKLIDYRAPYWRVKSLSQPAGTRSVALPATPRASSDPTSIRGIVPLGLKALLQSLGGGSR